MLKRKSFPGRELPWFLDAFEISSRVRPFEVRFVKPLFMNVIYSAWSLTSADINDWFSLMDCMMRQAAWIDVTANNVLQSILLKLVSLEW